MQRNEYKKTMLPTNALCNLEETVKRTVHLFKLI